MKNIYIFVGTSAELIKLAPVISELENRKIDFKIISSNQNHLRFEELKGFVKKKKADYIITIKLGKNPQNIYLRFIVWFVKTTANYYLYFRNIIPRKDRNKTYFIVHGDTVSTLLGSIVAKTTGVKLAHVESGLRSFNFFEPFPEEINRIVVSRLADYHFCPNKWAKNNLENISGKKTITKQNTVAEITLKALKLKDSHGIKSLRNKKYFVLVVHRQEHTLFNKRNTEKVIKNIIKHASDDLKCVFVMHKLTEDYLKSEKLYSKIKRKKNVILPPRLEYKKFVKLLYGSEFVATDGGSNQEECFVMGKPCLILRNHTERIEGLDKNALLVGDDIKKINKFIKNYKNYQQKKLIMKGKSPSEIIVDKLVK